ncbi:cyclodeaminase/cyclohydrolase family protein [Synergistes jonesii]|uniref:Methenyltetrahydrofolate cyclohydrolase n=1 Tax=Synergistes jonesii TaxID=2754 RepID=A0A073IP28_9BACT|nr:cyclodeaminase/cyclohydrolase family protein [Synergistes jonesii]KEJ91335.1 methenyltetrahydrofolate cyclohydrolase [Synergistes jonesii]OFB60403.1 methenyltetrahydrofolate cyclohydrolase [Synergistes jonesii]OFB61228.1 methenyltetrahydrofolate cyclohydrolase [Synergistes jonesii]OFB62889.1 methenyltetrahydrofolate cyclohydrolase [Synergistes jonesii]OFB66614.1 methenyltetrahydrofolate cyclohydrolase [Synergistes jonesii]
MKFEETTIKAFIDELASNSPAPGGGSVAALCGSLAAGLEAMVANLTLGKEKYRTSWDKMHKVLEEGEKLRAEFISLMNEDTESFNLFMQALKMPKETEEQKASRKAAMGEASKAATAVPLRTLESCVKAAELSFTAAKYGNSNAVSDAGVAALLAEAAGKAASYNVKINLPGIADEAFAKECRERMEKALAEVVKHADETAKLVEAAMI